MACVKSVSRSASVALSPEGPYMAAGTMAGAVDISFSSNANLEIFELDLRSEDLDLPVLGSCQSSERFNRLAWSCKGSNSGSFSLGLIAGGLVDGSIDIWNPDIVIRPKENETAHVAHVSYHKGPVRGLEFNSLTPNLLASGADDGEICIWDVSSPTEPSHFPPLKASGSTLPSEISYVSWNSKVQHILASTSSNGITVVWDLKKQKPVISVEDSLRRRCSVLQWHPDVATQLVVASDDDNLPALRLWDMRNTLTPVNEFIGHSKGIIAMSWCPSDSTYLLTCGKDNRTLCWNTLTGEVVRELPPGANWNFDVHWYPKVPGIISASSFDGKIGIFNIEACSRYNANSDGVGGYASVKLGAPKWYKKPAGVSFGFGGQLMSFYPKSPGVSEVVIQSLVTEQTLVSRSTEFESALQHGDRASLSVLCEKKSLECESEDDRETWELLKVMLEEDGAARSRMVTYLGFQLPVQEKAGAEISEDINALRIDDPVENSEPAISSNYGLFSADDGMDFFNNLPSPKADTPVQSSLNNVNNAFIVNNDTETSEDKLEEENDDTELDHTIQRALVVGDYKEAVEKCIAANKIADALVISHFGGNSLWEKTRDQYLKVSSSSYLKLVAAMVNNDLLSLVNTRPLKYWKEILASLCTFAQSEEWSMLCEALASRLLAAGSILPATQCYICGGNVDKTVEIWSRNVAHGVDGKSYVDLLQDLMEKTIVLSLATGKKQFSSSICQLVEKYCEILVSQGLQKTAAEYLNLLGSGESSPDLAILKERIAVSIEPATYDDFQHISGSTYSNDAVATSKSYYTDTATTQTHSSFGDNYSTLGRGFIPANSYATSQPAVFQPTMPSQPTVFQPTIPPQPTVFHPTMPPQSAVFHPTTPPQSAVFHPTTPPQSAVFHPTTPPQPAVFHPTTPPQSAVFHPTMPPQPAVFHPTTPPQPAVFQPTMPPQPAVFQPTMPPQPVVFQPTMPPQPAVFQPTTPPQITPPNYHRSPFPSAATAVAPKSSPTEPTQAPSPPTTVQTFDPSNLPAKHKPVVASLTRLFKETAEAMGGVRANPARKREIEDNSKKIGALFAELDRDSISKNASGKLVLLCEALDKGDYWTALNCQVELSTSEWDECNFWIATLKRMIKTKQSSARVS